MNGVKSIDQFPVLFWASSLSLAIHGLALVVPVGIEPKQSEVSPLEAVSLIPLSPNLKPRPSQAQVQPILSASPSISPNPPQPNLFTPPENEKATPPNPTVTPLKNPIDPNSKKQAPTSPNPIPQESTPPKKEDPVSKKPEIENSEQFAARTQKDLMQVTEQLGQQYGDRFSERSDTIAASPELFFTQPDSFYDKKGTPRLGLDKTFQIEKETPKLVLKAFEPSFRDAKFTVLLVEPYGGGLLYEIKKEGSPERVAFYLNLLSTPDRSGTIVVIWKQRPQI